MPKRNRQRKTDHQTVEVPIYLYLDFVKTKEGERALAAVSLFLPEASLYWNFDREVEITILFPKEFQWAIGNVLLENEERKENWEDWEEEEEWEEWEEGGGESFSPDWLDDTIIRELRDELEEVILNRLPAPPPSGYAKRLLDLEFVTAYPVGAFGKPPEGVQIVLHLHVGESVVSVSFENIPHLAEYSQKIKEFFGTLSKTLPKTIGDLTRDIILAQFPFIRSPEQTRNFQIKVKLLPSTGDIEEVVNAEKDSAIIDPDDRHTIFFPSPVSFPPKRTVKEILETVFILSSLLAEKRDTILALRKVLDVLEAGGKLTFGGGTTLSFDLRIHEQTVDEEEGGK